ncbi:hypothetical protein WJX73_009269 [Symbiochloris irregularis]|uniref:adenylate kinase n=1 Tax=Symbiochloris irregularis TaxID=706552 RepID=A0AAW1PBC9_9CHLO
MPTALGVKSQTLCWLSHADCCPTHRPHRTGSNHRRKLCQAANCKPPRIRTRVSGSSEMVLDKFEVPEVSSTLKVMISGPPAAGKGTQCERIVKKYGLVHISAGDLLRAEIEAGSEFGKKAKGFMDKGQLVPNEVVVQLVKSRLERPDAAKSGWLLDGYPRSSEQAVAIKEAGIEPDVFILINVEDESLVERVTGRRLDPETGKIYHIKHSPAPKEAEHRLVQRSDDNEEALRSRLATHHKNVTDVVSHYTDVVAEVNGDASMDEVFAKIDGLLSVYTAAGV